MCSLAGERGTAESEDLSFFKTRYVLDRMHTMVQDFSEAQNEAAQELGFGFLLQHNCGTINFALCRWMANHFDTRTRSIELFGNTCTFDVLDVRELLRIPAGVMDVTQHVQGYDLSKLRDIFRVDYHGIARVRLEEVMSADKGRGALFKMALTMFLRNALAWIAECTFVLMSQHVHAFKVR